MTGEPDLLERFARGEIAAAEFSHHDHVHMGFEMLRRHDFAESVLRFSRALRGMAANAGKPGAFNQTVTLAFLAIIAQRMEATPEVDFEAFAASNRDLFEKSLLSRWYRAEQLASPLASRSFLLPDPSAKRA